jgi:hypothetical protein
VTGAGSGWIRVLSKQIIAQEFPDDSRESRWTPTGKASEKAAVYQKLLIYTAISLFQ